MKKIDNIKSLLKRLDKEEVSKELLKEVLIAVETELMEMAENYEERIDVIMHKQLALEKEVIRISEAMNKLEQDIYEECEEQDVVCPYCNNEFEIYMDEITAGEVNCPECNNAIELSWDNDDDCDCGHGHCGDCC